MANASRDDNYVPTLLGVSNADGTTPVKIYADPTTHRLLVDLPGGSGDVVGPGSSTDNAVARFDGTTGKLLQNSAVIIADTTGAITGTQSVTIGVTGAATGTLLLKGTTSGTVTIQTAAAAGTYTLTLPTDDGTANQFLQTDGSGVLTWATASAAAGGSSTQVQYNNAGVLGGITNATTDGTTLTITTGRATTNFSPSSNDGAALGTTALQFSDLFLATGAVIDFANGNAVITHSSGILTVSTGDLRVTTAGTNTASAVTVGGTQTLTAKTLTAPKFANGGFIADANGNEEIIFTTTASAVNEITLANAATTNPVVLSTTGGDTNVDLRIAPKGTGVVSLYNADAGALGAVLESYQDSASPAASDVVGRHSFFGRDSGANKQEYARIDGNIESPTSTTEDGSITFAVVAAGTVTNKAKLTKTELAPSANDGLALGTGALSFADLFLASGGVINFNNGNATITHSAALLTFNTAITVGTSNSITCGTIELGAASDTTIARSAAGQISVEGVQVATLSNTVTLTNKVFSHTVEPAVDDTFTGEQITGFNAGATVAQWDAVYLNSSSNWVLTDADATATSGGVCVALASAAGTNGNPLTVVARGIVRNDGWTWTTVGAPLYLSGTAGAITQTAPTATDSVTRVVGYVMSDDCIYWNPSNDWITHT